jgi:hypothetical protein
MYISSFKIIYSVTVEFIITKTNFLPWQDVLD